MTKMRSLYTLLSAFLLLASGVDASHGAELTGRVDAPAGSGPAVVFLHGLTGGTLPEVDTVITHRSGGSDSRGTARHGIATMDIRRAHTGNTSFV